MMWSTQGPPWQAMSKLSNTLVQVQPSHMGYYSIQKWYLPHNSFVKLQGRGQLVHKMCVLIILICLNYILSHWTSLVLTSWTKCLISVSLSGPPFDACVYLACVISWTPYIGFITPVLNSVIWGIMLLAVPNFSPRLTKHNSWNWERILICQCPALFSKRRTEQNVITELEGT